MSLPEYVGASAIKRADPSGGTGLTTGATLTVSFNGGAFAAPTNTPAHVANGFWRVQLTAGEQANDQVDVQVTHPDGVPETRSYLNRNPTGGKVDSVVLIEPDGIVATSVATAALNGKGDWRVASTYPNNFGDLGITATIGAIVRTDQVGEVAAGAIQESSYGAGVSPTASIQAAHLDHLLQTATTTFPGNAGSILGEMLERSTTWRYVTEALSQAPSGGGGTDWTAAERNQIRYRLQMDGVTAAPASDAPLQLQVDTRAWAGSTGAVKIGSTTALAEVETNFVGNNGIVAASFGTDAISAAAFSQAAADKAKADVSGLSTFNPATDTVANVTTVQNVANNVSADVVAWQGFTIPGAGMVENDGSGDGRWTTKALEQGPVGSIGNIVTGQWRWNTDTTATDPGSGRVKINNAAFASANQLYISETTTDGQNAAAVLNSLIKNDQIILADDGAPGTFVRYSLTDPGTPNGGWWTFPVAHEDSSGSFINLLLLNVGFVETRSSSLTIQDVADAMRVTPTGTVSTDSVDDRLTKVQGTVPVGTAPDAAGGLRDVARVDGNAQAAINLNRGANAQQIGAVNDASATVTQFITDLPSTVTDAYKGRILTFATGSVVAKQAATITAYDGGTKQITVAATELTTAPNNGDTFYVS